MIIRAMMPSLTTNLPHKTSQNDKDDEGDEDEEENDNVMMILQM